MKRSRFTEEQIIALLREQEAGVATAELDVSQARKLKALEDENARLKKLLAEAMLDVAVLRDVTAKKW